MPVYRSPVSSQDYEYEELDSCGNTYPGGSRIEKYSHFEKYLQLHGFQKLEHGSFRQGFRRGNVVIKVPRCGDGEIDNLVEDRAWRKYKNNPTDKGIFLAPCRLLPNGCLMMVAVQVYGCEYRLPRWSEMVEGGQVGIYHNRCVAYDYALDINERSEWEEEWDVCSQYYNGIC